MNYNVNNENERIIIGEVGENLAESCTIDYSAWVEEYGEGNLRIRAIREGDAEPYPVASVETADGVATWTYTAADTAVKGFGEVQVLYYVGDVLAKSRVWKTYTYRSLNTSSEEVPDPYQDWLSEVERIGSQIEEDAESASDSATRAAGSASEAAESALSATRSESSAQEYASEASTSAASAASSASAASRSATEASNYEYYSEQYMNEAKAAKFGAESARTGAENAKTAAQTAATESEASATAAAQSAESIEASADLIQKLLANQIKDTATGTIASFPDGADMPMVSLVADIDPIQDTSGGAPSPSHICPISGWDSVDVSVAGKNLLNPENLTIKNVPYTEMVFSKAILLEAGVYTVSIENVVNATSWRFGFRFFESDGTVIIRAINGGVVSFNSSNDIADTYNGGTACLETDSETTTYVTLTLSRDVYVCFSFSSGDVSGTTTVDFQLELGSTATSYEPYQGQTYHTTLPQTVYGGTLDVVSGVLTVDRAMVDLGSLTWTYHANYQRFTTSDIYQDVAKPPNNNTQTGAISSVYVESTSNRTANPNYDKTFGISDGGSVQIRDEAYTDATALQTSLIGQTMVYFLATPTTIQLTPTQIDSLLGRNNVWADSGDVTVEYIADTKLYIQKVIS